MGLELSFSEITFILLMRHFDFLRNKGYSITQLTLYGREPYVVFSNKSYKREITISWAPQSDVHISFLDTSFFTGSKEFTIEEAARMFNIVLVESFNVEEVIKNKAEFVNTDMAPIIEGNKWL